MKDNKNPIKQYRDRIGHSIDDIRPVYIPLKVSIAGSLRDASTALLDSGNLCLLGWAGSGKTTQFRYLSALLAESSDRPAPILIPMRKAPTELSGLSARSFIAECASLAPPDELLYELDHQHHGSAVVMLDGLDEMLASCREQFKGAISRWKGECPRASWLLSTRPHVADLVPEGFVIAKLQSLDDSQVHEYLRKRQHTNVSNATLARLRDWPTLQTLAQNPLLLEMISRLSEEVGTLPSSRTELYSSCVDILLRSWDKARAIPIADQQASPEMVRNFLSELALRMWVSNSDTVDSKDISAVLGSDHIKDKESAAGAMSLLRTAVFVQQEPNRFAFSHKSFQEYFAALALTSEAAPKAAAILCESSSTALLEFVANLSNRIENLIAELVNRGHLDIAFKIVRALPPEREGERFYLLKRIGEGLGLPDSALRGPTESTAQTGELSSLWQKCKRASNPQQKGRYLEDFVEAAFSHVFHVVSKDRLTDFGEIDLICEPREINAFWGRWPSDFFVECKNHRDKSPVRDINEFIGKASACCARLGFFVSMTGFSEEAVNSMKRSWGKPGVPEIVWIIGTDFEKWMEANEHPEAFLKRMCRRANWGRE